MEMDKDFEQLAREAAERQDIEQDITGEDPVVRAAKCKGIPASREDREAALELYKGGVGVCEIARRTGFAQSTISRWVTQYHVNKNKTKPKQAANKPTPPPQNVSGVDADKVQKLLAAAMECVQRVCENAETVSVGFAMGELAAYLRLAGKEIEKK